MSQLILGKRPIKIGLVLRGEALKPAFWTAYFGIQPEFSARKGDFTRAPNGILRDMPHIWGVWLYRCKAKQIKSIDEGVLLLMKALHLPRADFKEVLSDEGCEAILSIFVNNSDGKNPANYGKITTDFIASTGAELSLDVVDPD